MFGTVAPHGGGLLRQEFSRDIDRHIGGDLRRGIDQDARLAGRAGAELDQRGGERNKAAIARAFARRIFSSVRVG